MNPDDFERRMRTGECFHALRVLPGAWPVLRLDGRGFSRLTEARFEKPFDARFHELMCRTAEALLVELGAVYAYTESDEISVVLDRGSELFDREVEKLVSISASVASSTFSLGLGVPAQFDSRLWVGAGTAAVADYFRWRQADAGRCCLNGWAYWMLRKAGRTVVEATAQLAGRPVAYKNELLFQNGVNFNDVPAWQKRGTALTWETHQKEGLDPRTGARTSAVRRRVRIDRDLPLGDDYGRFVLAILESGQTGGGEKDVRPEAARTSKG
jgi:tRNA(His) 5'-end guanylyltransferase